VSGPDHDDAAEVVERLVDSYLSPRPEVQHLGTYELPRVEDVARVVELCRGVLFPGFVGPGVAGAGRDALRQKVATRLEELRAALHQPLYRALHHKSELRAGQDRAECADCHRRAGELTRRFLARLPAIREAVARDVRAAVDGDPAASGPDEVVVCYPGLYAVTVHRLAAALRALGAATIPRMMAELAHERTGIDIHPGATIGDAFFIDHGTGVVIGETTVIGDRVRIYQGVTLGALTVPRGEERPAPGVRRHPTIEDDVVIYAGATILGGDTVIGRGAVIGGNAWVTASVAPGAVVAGSVSRRERRPSPVEPAAV
jgi:serine O-acetyltransferase